MSSNSRKQLEAWINNIDVKADSVLDIGGSQLPIKGRVKSWDVKDYKILDLADPHITAIKPDIVCDIQNTQELQAAEFKLESGLSKFEQITDHFDVAFCIEVAEYWYNPLRALGNINLLLKQGGLLYISFHFIYPIHKPSGLDYLRYTEFGVRKLLSEAGFIIDDFALRTFEQGSDNLSIAMGVEGMRPDKDYDRHHAQGYLIRARKV